MKLKKLITYNVIAAVLTFSSAQHSIPKNLENLLKPGKSIYLDIDNDGKKEKIFSGYEADSEVLFITDDSNKYICYSHECTGGFFNLFKIREKYIFKLRETIYSVPGETCTFDWSGLEEEWTLYKSRFKDEFIWKQNKLIPQHRWTIQINSFPKRKEAIDYVNKFLKQGYDAYIQYRVIDDGDENNLSAENNVLLGSYKERNEAEEALNKFIEEYPKTKPFIKSKEDTVHCEKL